MELPAPLRQAVDGLLEQTSQQALRQAARTLSDRYRAELRDGRLHMAGELAVKAYLAARMPATYAAVRASLDALGQARPDFSPETLLDIGAGPGTVVWAAAELWPGLARATLVEASAAARQTGESLAQRAGLGVEATWIDADATLDSPAGRPAELVTASYLLDEIAPAARPGLIERLWSLTLDTLLIVEPGTPAGWRRILDTRRHLTEAGAHILAPCPHQEPCPLAAPDWCHFSRRVARSRIHRLTKDADVPWEDEKFIFVAASRRPAASHASRVLTSPKTGSGKVALKLCRPDGRAEEKLFTRRDGPAFKAARRVDWGDAFEP